MWGELAASLPSYSVVTKSHIEKVEYWELAPLTGNVDKQPDELQSNSAG